MKQSNSSWLFVLLIIAVFAVAAGWYLRQADRPGSLPSPSTTVTPPATEKPGPLHPLAALPDQAERGALVELPALDDSDAYFALALGDVFGDRIGDLLVASGLIEKFVTTVDNLPRSYVAERIRPLRPLPGSFLVEPVGIETYAIHADNAARYRPFVDLIEAADSLTIVETYRRFYPLLQQAYVSLGYPDGYFNDRLVEVIDHLLETPENPTDLTLTRPHVLYEFADAELESRSAGQKLLLRAGSENAARIKAVLRQLRALIA